MLRWAQRVGSDDVFRRRLQNMSLSAQTGREDEPAGEITGLIRPDHSRNPVSEYAGMSVCIPRVRELAENFPPRQSSREAHGDEYSVRYGIQIRSTHTHTS
jgi:hypothetical protein